MSLTFALPLLVGPRVAAQEMPGEYKTVLSTLGKTGDFKEGVLKINIPRNDLRVTIGQRPAPTPFGFGGWIALTKGTGGGNVLMGDLVLTEDEVNPVMSAVLENGLDVTALHNHFFWEQPRIFYMHVRGRPLHRLQPQHTIAARPLADRFEPASREASVRLPILMLTAAKPVRRRASPIRRFG